MFSFPSILIRSLLFYFSSCIEEEENCIGNASKKVTERKRKKEIFLPFSKRSDSAQHIHYQPLQMNNGRTVSISPSLIPQIIFSPLPQLSTNSGGATRVIDHLNLLYAIPQCINEETTSKIVGCRQCASEK